jgi:hypothetical protein
MAESFQKPDYVFDGNYANFQRTLKLLEHFFHTKQIKNKMIDPQGKVSLRGIYYFMLMSTCPNKHDINWAMRDICDQNDIDRAGIQTVQERTRYRDILEKFEATVFNNQSEEITSQFLCEVLDLIHILLQISLKYKRLSMPIFMLLFDFFRRFILTGLNTHVKIRPKHH